MDAIASTDIAYEAIKSGKPVIAAHGPGEFTGGGHFIVYTSVNSAGEVYVYDPNNAAKCGYYSWDFLKRDIGEPQYFVPKVAK